MAKKTRFAASRDACERFALAFDLHFDGGRFQPHWGRAALEELERAGDYRSLSTYGLQLYNLLGAADPNRADFQFLALKGVHGALSAIDPQHDQTWLHWALRLGFAGDDPRAEALAYGSFLEQFPSDPRAKTIESWRDEAARQFFNLELLVAKGLARRGQFFAPVVRWESDLRQPSLQESAVFPEFVMETIRAREQLSARLGSVPDKQLRMWFRLEPGAMLKREELRRFVRKTNCEDLARMREVRPNARMPIAAGTCR